MQGNAACFGRALGHSRLKQIFLEWFQLVNLLVSCIWPAPGSTLAQIDLPFHKHLFFIMDKHLHIVSFSIPWPPDYGGAMDVFYKLKALAQMGIKIHLHCFQYDRQPAPELEEFCTEVHYYSRQLGLVRQFSRLPYIVKTRINEELKQRLLKDEHPILLEGIHTTGLLLDGAFAQRRVYLRMHNVENHYYRSLAKSASQFARASYYWLESQRLKAYEERPLPCACVFPIAAPDARYFEGFYPKWKLVSAFHGEQEVLSQSGRGKHLLYHGDLSVAENEKAAFFLLGVTREAGVDLVVAGKKPSPRLRKAMVRYSKASLMADPSRPQMQEQIREAAGILLPAWQTTGLRLKLLVSLFRGRHCIVSPEMVADTGLEGLCHVARDRSEWVALLQKLVEKDFTDEEIDKRSHVLAPFSDTYQARLIAEEVFGS